MSRKKKHPEHVNHERWLVSYADFITLLFAVFVVLYAGSQVDQRKVGKLALAIQVAFQELGIFQASTTRPPVDDSESMPFADTQLIQNVDRRMAFGKISPPAPKAADKPGIKLTTDSVRDVLTKKLTVELLKKKVRLRQGPDGLILSLTEMGFYTPGSDVLVESSRETLDRLAEVLEPTGLYLRIEGHTDNIPIHNARFASNWELSSARATGLVRVFIERYKFAPERLAAAGYAEFHPLQSNDTDEGRRVNRRVDIVILDPARLAPVDLNAESDKSSGNAKHMDALPALLPATPKPSQPEPPAGMPTPKTGSGAPVSTEKPSSQMKPKPGTPAVVPAMPTVMPSAESKDRPH